MKHILITGSNRGIGLATVNTYLKQGDVMMYACCRNPEFASDLLELKDTHPDNLAIIPLEVTQQESIDSAFEQVSELTDHLDVLINNAGIARGNQSLEYITATMMMEHYAVNTVAPLMISKRFLPLLKEGAKLVHISTEMASLTTRTYGGNYAYCSSKAALNMMMRAGAVDLRSRGIITIALDPGWVRTDMGGQSASISPEESANGIVSVITGLTMNDNGRYLAYDGSEHPW